VKTPSELGEDLRRKRGIRFELDGMPNGVEVMSPVVDDKVENEGRDKCSV
jgi:hypothetical protein